jgi:UDP-2,4-diacetamido-2,4,6-trideoxy-beta-L-altropyranose hydrolase
MKPSVYFRTEGNENTGLGHLFRCLSLAEILQPAFTSTFILTSKTPQALFERINFAGAKHVYIDSSSEQQEIEWIKSNVVRSGIIIIDSYILSDDYLDSLLSLGYKTVYIDDQAKSDVRSYAVINHIVGSEKIQYKNVNGTQLLGTKYAILRKEFLTHTKSEVKGDFSCENVLISLGGADQNQVTNKIVKNLLSFPELKIDVLVGAGFKGLTELNQLAANGRVNILKELKASGIVDAVSRASVAIITPGMISYEFFSVGIPALCGYISKFQHEVVKQFSSYGLVADVEDFNGEKLNFALQSMSAAMANKQVEAQGRLFDGKSGNRLVEAFQKMYDKP